MDDTDPGGQSLSTPEADLLERVDAVESFFEVARKMVEVGDLTWAEAAKDFRLLAINAALRRQLETIDAACLLCRNGLGHLAVSFVRAAFEDVIYLEFFKSLSLEDSQELFVLFANWDGLRSLLVQRDHIGDEAMSELWFTTTFLDGAAQAKEKVRVKLTELQRKHRWAGGLLPSASWIAERAGHKEPYEYLHSATSRAVHFSAGEILRRSWGHPTGILTTAKPAFRSHLAAFALDQLWQRYLDTWIVADEVFEQAGLNSDESLTFEDLRPHIERLTSMANVTLVHAAEWNLTPDGPLNLG